MRRRRLGTDQRELVRRAQAGDRAAVEELLVETEGLARMWARMCHKRFSGLEFDDLVQYALLGILEAIETFDPNRGTQFSTHASWCIRGQFSSARRNDGLICLPGHVTETEAGRRRHPNPARVVQSLDETVETPSGDIVLFGDMLASTNDTASSVIEGPHPLWSDILCAVACLPPHERAAIELRYGLKDGVRRSLEECASCLDLSRQGVDHRCRSAIRHLRKYLANQ